MNAIITIQGVNKQLFLFFETNKTIIFFVFLIINFTLDV